MDARADKRQAPRYPVNFQVVCRSKGQDLPGRALNLSRGGVLVTTPGLLTAGMLIEVSLAVPGTEAIQFKGIVRYASQDMGMGVEFLEVLPHHQDRFTAYLNQLAIVPGLVAN